MEGSDFWLRYPACCIENTPKKALKCGGQRIDCLQNVDPRNDTTVRSLGFLLASFTSDLELKKPASRNCYWAWTIKPQ